VNQVCDRHNADVLFGAAEFYEDRGDWWLHVLVVMPDHLHMLASFAPEVRMRTTLRAWKRFTARTTALEWQRDWFDHRLRTEESYREKADYILANPVRAGLIARAEDWPYVRIAR
jgi:putative transposase